MTQVAEKEIYTTNNKSKKGGTKRYNLLMPTILFDEVQSIADQQHITVLELLRHFIRIGLVVAKIAQNPNASIIIREGDREKEIVFI